MMKVSKDELHRMNDTSVALRDGSGYIIYLETGHMLHCLVLLPLPAVHISYFRRTAKAMVDE